jgi:hypothetical protein
MPLPIPRAVDEPRTAYVEQFGGAGGIDQHALKRRTTSGLVEERMGMDAKLKEVRSPPRAGALKDSLVFVRDSDGTRSSCGGGCDGAGGSLRSATLKFRRPAIQSGQWRCQCIMCLSCLVCLPCVA